MIPKQYAGRIGFVLLFAVLVGTAILIQLPDDRLMSLPDMGEMPDFTLPSVDGGNFTFSSTSGEIRLVNFIYTKCQMGCSTQTLMLSHVIDRVNELGYQSSVHTITIDFDYKQDSMENLSRYANEFRGSDDRWEFLLGNELQTLNVTEGWGFYFEEDNSTEMQMDGITYVHPFILYIVDENDHLRRQFLGLDWETEEVIEVIEFLLDED